MITLNLKNVMDEKGISIQDLSDQTKLSRNTISQMYNGNSKGIQFESLNKLVKVLGVNVFELIVDEYDTKNLIPTVDLLVDEDNFAIEVNLIDDDINTIFSFEMYLDFDKTQNTIELSAPSDDSLEYSNMLFFFDDVPSYIKEYTFFQITYDTLKKLSNNKEKLLELYEFDYSYFIENDSYFIFKLDTITENNRYIWNKNMIIDKSKTIDLLIEKYSLRYVSELIK